MNTWTLSPQGQLDDEDFVTAAIVEFGPGRITVLNCGLQPEQAVMLYTDGLTEARDAQGDMFDVLAACQDLAPPAPRTGPDIAGRGVANPLRAIWCASAMLDHLGHPEAADTKDFTQLVLEGITHR